jgi:hypothetical protein
MNTTTYGKGRYLAEILEQGLTTSAAKGTPCFYLQLQILNRYDANGGLVDCPQYERTYTQYLANETGVNILRADLKALGVQVTTFAQLDPATPDHVNLVGRQIDVTCELEAYQGRQRERWGIARTRSTLAPEAVRALDDQFGHLLRGGNGQAQPAPAVNAPNDTDAPNESEAPR